MSWDHGHGPVGLLLEHLRTRVRAGQSHVWLSGPAREVMRAWHLQQRGGRGAAAPGGRAPAVSAVSAVSTGPAVSTVSTVSTGARPSVPVLAGLGPGTGDKAVWPEAGVDPVVEASLAGVRAGVMSCPAYVRLREGGGLGGTMVFAAGHPGSPLVFVGEAPGVEEEKAGEPFVGPAGQLLTKMIMAMGLQRPQVYVTHVVKFRPGAGPGGEESPSRRPTAEEMAAALPHLHRELAVLKPRVLVALGATALEGLGGGATPIAEARGHWREFQGIPLMPTFHPGYLLHNESLAERRKVWEDLLQVMEKLGLPISLKQRGFFKG